MVRVQVHHTLIIHLLVDVDLGIPIILQHNVL